MVGISHRKADLGLRERFVRSRAGIVALLSGEGERRGGVVLSTCNRFEIYWWGSSDWLAWFHATAAEQGVPLPPAAVVGKDGANAARHLLRVSAGLESQVVGEAEILGQVRRAWELARESGATCPELDLVFDSALAAGRRVREETSIGAHRASIGSVAVDFARTRIGGLNGCRVLVLGTGKAARTVLSSLQGTGARVRLSSRGNDRAAQLASEFDAMWTPWDALDRALAEADVVFAATSAPTPVLSAGELEVALDSRASFTIVDLGVPRNVDAGARALKGIRVVDLDDLRAADRSEGRPSLGVLEVAGELVEEEVRRLIERLGDPTEAPTEPLSGREATLPAGADI
jgi:glutamyl-tRNA reductase